MYRARPSVMAAACMAQINGSGDGRMSANGSSDPKESCCNEVDSSSEGRSNGLHSSTDVLHRTTVSVPQPSRSRTASDGKIKLFSTRRSRSSSSRSSFSSMGESIGSAVWTPAELYLTNRTVCYRLLSQGQECEMYLEDLVGVQYTPVGGGKACEMSIHLFPLVTRTFAKKKARRLVEVVVRFGNTDNLKDNEDEAALWKSRILVMANKACMEIFEQTDSVQKCSDTDGDKTLLEQRHFLVFLNPVAGSRKGEANYKTYVDPLFRLADIKCDIKVTKHQNYAYDYVRGHNLSQYSGIIISSGDGLLYEVINGIMTRPDWEQVVKIPIGMLPTGSGNALVASTLYESKEDFNLEMAAFQIICGGVSPLDLATVETSDGGRCIMTLLANWGIIADVDIESERMRAIGEARFTLGALNCIRKKRLYKGRLSYLLPKDSKKEPEAVPLDPALLDHPRESEDDPESSISSLNGLGNREEDSGNGAHAENDSSISLSEKGSEESGLNDEDIDATDGNQNSFQRNSESHVLYGPPTDLLVPFNEKVPETWSTIEQDFLAICPLLISHVGRTFIADPNFHLGSGKMRLMWIDGKISRLGTLKVFTDAEKGRHVDKAEVKLTDAVTFRIEPLEEDDRGIITVDGERVKKYGPIQAQVHPHLARVMTRRRREDRTAP